MSCSPWGCTESDTTERLCIARTGGFVVLVNVNRGTMNTGAHVSFQISVFMFFRFIPRGGTVGSYCHFIFSF